MTGTIDASLPHILVAMLRLNPEIEVLKRRNGDLQIGWDPETAVIVPTESSADRRAVLQLVGMLDGSLSSGAIFRRAAQTGLSELRAARIIDALRTSGHLIAEAACAQGSVRVHGTGPLAASIAEQLRTTAVSVSRTNEVRSLADLRHWSFDLVVLTDALAWDPMFIHELLRARVDHLVVRTRDGKGIVGPLVVPGVTSCLLCADLTRSAYDPEWPWLAAQLIGRSGTSSPITRSATTTFAVAAIQARLGERANDPASAIDSTIEIDARRFEIGRRHWPRQPECACQNLANQPKQRGKAVS